MNCRRGQMQHVCLNREGGVVWFLGTRAFRQDKIGNLTLVDRVVHATLPNLKHDVAIQRFAGLWFGLVGTENGWQNRSQVPQQLIMEKMHGLRTLDGVQECSVEISMWRSGEEFGQLLAAVTERSGNHFSIENLVVDMNECSNKRVRARNFRSAVKTSTNLQRGGKCMSVE